MPGYSLAGSCLSIASLIINRPMMSCAFEGTSVRWLVCPFVQVQMGWLHLWPNPISIAFFWRATALFHVLCCLYTSIHFLELPQMCHMKPGGGNACQKVTNLQQKMQRKKVKWREKGRDRKKSTQMGYLLSFAKKRTLSFGMQCENAPYYSRQHS